MSTTTTVATLTELYAALKTAGGGDTILLQGGDYGKFQLMAKSGFNYQFPSNVTIASADPLNPAVFSGVDVREGKNITFDGIKFDYTFTAGTPIWVKPFIFSNSQNITIRNSTFDGDVASGVSQEADGYAYGIGLVMRNCDGSTIENNEIFNFHRGLTMGSGDNAVIRGNEVHSIRSDGMNFSMMKGVLIEGNYIHDFENSEGSADHSDMIQFWTNGATEASRDIIIRGNRLDVGNGDNTQSIFMRNDQVDRGLAGSEMYYQNVLIENNLITNAHAHGITIGETNGLIIRNNSVLHSDGGNVDGADRTSEIPRINVAGSSTNVTIEYNVTSMITGPSGQAGWNVKNNAFVQDQSPLLPGYYGDEFVSSTLNPADGVHQFVSVSGGMIQQLGAGAGATKAFAPTANTEAHFQVYDSTTDAAARVFDASGTIANFSSLPAGTTFTWDFGDGTTTTGATATHSYAQGGHYNATLTVRLPNGQSDTQGAKIDIAGSDILSFDLSKGLVAYGYGQETQLDSSALSNGIAIQSQGVAVSIDRGHMTEIFEADNFKIDLKIQASATSSVGEVFRLHQSFIAQVDGNGELSFRVFPKDQPMVEIKTKGALLNDMSLHDISIEFDNGIIRAVVDGAVLAEAQMPSVLRAMGDANLNFGSGSGGINFASTISAFTITTDEQDFQSGVATTISQTNTAWSAAVEPAPIEVVSSESSPNDHLDQPLLDTTQTNTSAPTSESTTDSSAWSFKADYSLSEGSIVKASGTAKVVTTGTDTDLEFGGGQGQATLGRVEALEASDKLGFSVDFQRDNTDGGDVRLVWNHLKMGLELVDDGLRVRVATADEGFKSFTVKNLGLQDLESHNAVVMVDTKDDRLQVVLDNKVVLDVNNVDFDVIDAGGREWGWKLGSAWSDAMTGRITDFDLGDRFEFLGTNDGLTA